MWNLTLVIIVELGYFHAKNCLEKLPVLCFAVKENFFDTIWRTYFPQYLAVQTVEYMAALNVDYIVWIITVLGTITVILHVPTFFI